MRLKGKVALVTGSSRGIGKAVALRFADEGADIAVNYVRNADKAEGVVKAIRSKGRRAMAVQADVAERTQVDAMVSRVLEAWGALDILVSNAGIIIDRAFVDSTAEDWRSAIETNLQGFFNVTQAVLPQMTARRWGRVIATGSIITEVFDFGGNRYAVCTATKAGITTMLKPIAVEVAPYGITVNAVSPGYIATEMLAEISQEGLEAAAKLIPMKRYGRPEEIAAAMAFLASDDAAYITGQVLRVNGGMSM